MSDEQFMRAALSEARLAEACGEVPIGAVVVQNGEIIAAAGNCKEQKLLSTAHAEMCVLDEAMKKAGKYLYDCTLYVTLEPCAMCAGAMINARLGRLVFGAYDSKAGCAGTVYDLISDGKFNHRVEKIGGVLEKECAELLSQFFRSKRIKKC